MKKIAKLFVLFSMSVFLSSCGGQNQTNSPKENIKAETKDIVTSPGSNDPNIHTKYEYADSIGKRLIIQNSFPRGGIVSSPGILPYKIRKFALICFYYIYNGIGGKEVGGIPHIHYISSL